MITWKDVMKFSLRENPIIFDVGGFLGDWTEEALRYHPSAKVYVFEPVEGYYNIIKSRYADNPNIQVFNFGLSNETKSIDISVSGDSSSTHRVVGSSERIHLMNISDFVKAENIEKIDLIKINIEGEEYPLLEWMLTSDDLVRFDNFLIQFHTFVDNFANRRLYIQEELHKKNYQQIFNFEMVFEGWTIKN
jgi:FkbM family methyltransferase